MNEYEQITELDEQLIKIQLELAQLWQQVGGSKKLFPPTLKVNTIPWEEKLTN